MLNSHGSSAPAAGDVEAQRLYLVNKVKTLRQELSATLSKLNDLVPAVSRLPPELTSNIFLHYVQGVERLRGRVLLPPIRLITHVCRRWRNIAIEYGCLWARIDASCHPKLLDFVIQRSGQSLLDVTFSRYLHPSRAQAITASLLRESHRIGALTIDRTSPALDYLPTSFELPQLRTLLLEMSGPRSIPSTISLLRSSSLTRCTISYMRTEMWTELAVCRSLEVLCIAQSFISTDIVTVRDVLNELSNLQELQLSLSLRKKRHVHDEGSAVADIRSTPISLVALRRLDLTLLGNLSYCTSLLLLLVTSPDADVTIDMKSTIISSRDSLPEDVTALSAAVSSLISRDVEAFVGLDVVSDYHGLDLVFSRANSQNISLQVDGQKISKINSDTLVRTLTFIVPAELGLLSAVCRALVPERLLTLSLDSVLPMKGPKVLKEVGEMVNGLPNLYTLVLKDCGPAFISALSMKGDLDLCRAKVLAVRRSVLRPCRRSIHQRCKGCLSALHYVLKKELSPQNATLPSLKIYSNSKTESTDLEGFLEVAEEVYYECMDDPSISRRLKRSGDYDNLKIGHES